MAAPPQPYPPVMAPPPVPEGWKADWSAEYNTWYVLQQTDSSNTACNAPNTYRTEFQVLH
jgi:hypothetical protein